MSSHVALRTLGRGGGLLPFGGFLLEALDEAICDGVVACEGRDLARDAEGFGEFSFFLEKKGDEAREEEEIVFEVVRPYRQFGGADGL